MDRGKNEEFNEPKAMIAGAREHTKNDVVLEETTVVWGVLRAHREDLEEIYHVIYNVERVVNENMSVGR